jgi:hypothetical protein
MPNEGTNSKRKLTMFNTCFSNAVRGKKKERGGGVFQFLAPCVFGRLLMTVIYSPKHTAFLSFKCLKQLSADCENLWVQMSFSLHCSFCLTTFSLQYTITKLYT